MTPISLFWISGDWLKATVDLSCLEAALPVCLLACSQRPSDSYYSASPTSLYGSFSEGGKTQAQRDDLWPAE